MREIKFRAWDNHLSCYHYDVEFITDSYWDSDGRPVFLSEHQEGDYADCEDAFEDNFILEQYTGLKDQEGKEIYEGDILEGFDDVKFEDGRYYCNLRGARIFTLEELCCDMDYPKPKIIGNIHENPELLK